MAMNSLGLGFVFTARDLASGTMRKVEGNFKKLDATTAASAKAFQNNVKTAVAGLAVAAAGAIAVGGAFKLAGKFGEFEQGLSKVGAITRATEADMALLRDRAIQAGLETQFSPTEALLGLEALGLRGFTTAESMEALGGALDLAAGGQIGVEQAASTAASALRVFGMEAEQAGVASDKLLKISNLTAISAGDLELMLGTVARGASSTKQSLDEMLVSMGLVKNTGVDASVAASAVSSALQFIAKNQKQFKELGVSVTDANGDFRSFIDIVTDTNAVLQDKLPNAADRTAKGLELFGRFGVASFQAITTQLENGIKDAKGNLLIGAEAVAYLRNEMENAEGTAAKFREQLLDTFEGQKTLLQGSLQTLGIISGEAFAQAFKPIVSVLIAGINNLIGLIQAIPAPVKKFLGIAFVLTASLVTIGGLVMAGVAAFALLKMAVIAFAAPLATAAVALGAITAAAFGAVAVFKLLRKAFDENLGGFGDTMTRVFGQVRLFFDAIKQLTSSGNLSGDVLTKLIDPANAGVLTMVQRFQQARHRVQQFFVGLKDGFMAIWRTLGPVFHALGNAVSDLMAEFGFGSKELGLFTSKGEDFRSTGEAIGRIIGEVARFIMSGLVVAVRVAITVIQGLKLAWQVLGPLIMLTVGTFVLLLRILEPVISFVGDLVQSIATAEGGIGTWIARLGLLGGVLMWLASGPLVGVIGALMGPVGLVVAAAAAGLAIGTWIDSALGLSDMISEWAKEFPGLAKAMGVTVHSLDDLDEAYKRVIKTRGQVAAFEDFEAAAAAAGMTSTAFAEKRASEIARESTAQDLGLSKDEIKRRLMAGEDVFKELTGPAVPAEAAANGTAAAADGEVNRSKAAQRQQTDAFEEALTRASGAGGKGAPTQIKASLKIDQTQFAEIVKQAQVQAGSLDFEADFGQLGEF